MHRGARLCRKRRSLGQEPLVRFAKRSRRRQDPAAILGNHRQGALREIAEIVGKIGIDPIDDAFMRIRAVLAKRHVAQQKIPQLSAP